MSQDVPSGFGSYYMPMGFGGFGATSTPVDSFDDATDMSILSLEQRAFRTPSSYDSETPPDIFTDESMSPSSHTSSMLDMTDPMQASSIVPDMDFYGSFFDGRSFSALHPVHPAAHVTSSSIPDLDYFDDNSQAIPSQNDHPTRGTSFPNSRPPTRNSFCFSPRSGQSIPDRLNSSMDDTIDECDSSPTSSSSQCEGRDHEFYRRGMDPVDGLYHCPMEADGTCDFPPKALKCEYHKHIDSHLKPFRCRKPGCANQAFSSVACRLRHEREMHKMHNAEEFLCRYDGPCERKQSGNGFARSFNRGDHEKRVHHIFQENPRSKGRPKGASGEASSTHSSVRRNSAHRKMSHRDIHNTSDESSTSTIGASVSNNPSPVAGPLANSPRDSYMVFPGLHSGTNFGIPPNTTLSLMQNQVIPSSPVTKRTRFAKGSVKLNTRGGSQTSKRRQEYVRQWTEHARRLQDFTSQLPDIPDDSSDNLVRSIEEEARALRHLLNDRIDPQTIGNSSSW